MQTNDDPSGVLPSALPPATDFMLARLAAIVESSEDAIISKDLNGVITSWNQGAQRLFGYTDQEMIGQPVQRLIPEDRFDEEPRILQRIRMGQRIDHYETLRRRKDGSLVHISLTVSPIKDRTGRIVGASKIARDITRLKQAEQQLQESAVELERRIAERTQELLASRERLRALASELTLTEQRERRRLATELHDYLAQLVVASRLRLSQIIPRIADPEVSASVSQVDSMLDQALTYTRSLVAELSPHTLYQFGLAKSLQWLGEQMQQHGLLVSVKIGPTPFTLADDQAVLLFQSVRELLFNIIKHAKTDRATLTVNVDEDQELRICVEDEGVGFDMAAITARPTLAENSGCSAFANEWDSWEANAKSRRRSAGEPWRSYVFRFPTDRRTNPWVHNRPSLSPPGCRPRTRRRPSRSCSSTTMPWSARGSAASWTVMPT